MEPALHVLSTRPEHERLELTPGGRTMARTLGLLPAGTLPVLVWLVLEDAAGAGEVDVLAAVFGGSALATLLLSGWVEDRLAGFFEAVGGGR